MVPDSSHKVSRVSWYSGIRSFLPVLRLRGFHPLWPVFPGPFCWTSSRLLRTRTPICTHIGLGSSWFARRYFRNHFCFLFLRLLRCFSSPGSLRMTIGIAPFHHTVTEVSSAGFPHSDICGSSDICSLPQLFAAYHVFLRLLVPRHPPCALSCLT